MKLHYKKNDAILFDKLSGNGNIGIYKTGRYLHLACRDDSGIGVVQTCVNKIGGNIIYGADGDYKIGVLFHDNARPVIGLNDMCNESLVYKGVNDMPAWSLVVIRRIIDSLGQNIVFTNFNGKQKNMIIGHDLIRRANERVEFYGGMNVVDRFVNSTININGYLCSVSILQKLCYMLPNMNEYDRRYYIALHKHHIKIVLDYVNDNKDDPKLVMYGSFVLDKIKENI